MAQPYKLTKWNGPHFPTQQEVTARLASEGAAPALRADPPGNFREARRYPYAVTLWVFSGGLSLQFQSENGAAREVLLRPGDRIDTLPGTRFSLKVSGEGYALYAVAAPFCLPALGMAAHDERSLPEKRSA